MPRYLNRDSQLFGCDRASGTRSSHRSDRWHSSSRISGGPAIRRADLADKRAADVWTLAMLEPLRWIAE